MCQLGEHTSSNAVAMPLNTRRASSKVCGDPLMHACVGLNTSCNPLVPCRGASLLTSSTAICPSIWVSHTILHSKCRPDHAEHTYRECRDASHVPRHGSSSTHQAALVERERPYPGNHELTSYLKRSKAIMDGYYFVV